MILQFATHLYPLGYSALLVALVHHSFIALFLGRKQLSGSVLH